MTCEGRPGVGLPRENRQLSPEEKQMDTVLEHRCQPPTAGLPVQTLASLPATAFLTSGHTVGLTVDSKFPNSLERVYIDGFRIMAGKGSQRAWKWAGQHVRQRQKGSGERKRQNKVTCVS